MSTYYIATTITTSNPSNENATLLSTDNVLTSLLPFNASAISNGEFGADYFTLVPGPNVITTNFLNDAPFTVQILSPSDPNNIYAALTDPITGEQLSSYAGAPATDNGPFGTASVNVTETLETVHSQHISVANTSNNVVAGDVWDLNLTAQATSQSEGTAWGLNIENYVAHYNAIAGYVIDLNPNTISVGNGSGNTVDGNMNEFNLTATGQNAVAIGSTTFSIYDLYYQVQNDPDDEAVVTFDQFNMGHNNITVGNGSDTINGEMSSMDLAAIGGSGIGDGGVEVLMGLGLGFSPSFLMGDNIISGGNGTYTIAGDMNTLSLLVDNYGMNSGDFFASQQMDSINIVMGHDTITTGNGASTIVGSTFFADITADSGIANDGSNNGSSIAASVVFDPTNGTYVNDGSHWDFSSNHITVGNGSNTIYGSAEDVDFTVTAGTVTGNGWMYAAGGTHIPAGDIGYLFTNGAINGGIAYAISNVDANISDLVVELGHNTIKAGNGANIIYGDGDQFVVDLTGGTVESGLNGFSTLTSSSTGPSDLSYQTVTQDGNVNNEGGFATASFEGNHITMGGNSITVGNGNDIVDTDFAMINLEANQGSDPFNNGSAVATFGGGAPLDPQFTVYPDLFENLTVDQGNILTMAGSTVTLGNGNDIVVDHVLDFQGGLSSYFNSAAGYHIDGGNPNSLQNDNQLIFQGGDTINAGTGADAFVFSLLNIGGLEGVTGQAGLVTAGTDRMVMQGNNVINGFNANTDVLVFNGANAANMLNSMTATYNATNHTETLTFGSMTQNNVTQTFYYGGNDGGNAALDGNPVVDGSGHLVYSNTPTTQTSSLVLTGISSQQAANNIHVELFGSNGNSAFTDVGTLSHSIAVATQVHLAAL